MDIKLENILISDDGHLQLCDFGFSMPKDNLVRSKMGTSIYMAPEIYGASQMPCKASTTDIFSLGVLFFMLAFGAPPFNSAEFSDGFFSFLKMRPDSTDFFKFHPHTRQLYRDNKLSESFMRMLLAMLKAEPTSRVQRADDLLSFAFFEDVEDVQQELNYGATNIISAHVECTC